jgi:hypothetical protein
MGVNSSHTIFSNRSKMDSQTAILDSNPGDFLCIWRHPIAEIGVDIDEKLPEGYQIGQLSIAQTGVLWSSGTTGYHPKKDKND